MTEGLRVPEDLADQPGIDAESAFRGLGRRRTNSGSAILFSFFAG
jgi:hypothetical protein